MEISIQSAKETMEQTFGFSKFRAHQEEIIKWVLAGNDVMAVMPTGSGKSLTFQLPAILLPGTTLVISPLVSLIDDQINSLRKRGICVARLHSSLNEDELQFENKLIDGVSPPKLVYVAPERLQSPVFLEEISHLTISLIVVDEAHCVSMWGHNFRPAYQLISNFRTNLTNNPRILALTATAPINVRKDTINMLRLDDPKTVFADVDRPEISLRVAPFDTACEKEDWLFELLRTDPKKTVVYCSTIATVDRLASLMLGAGKYNGSMNGSERQNSASKFRTGEVSILFATTAFGMGIDDPSIRRIIHFEMPGSLERLVQELGRAARDGKPGEHILCYQPPDLATLLYFIEVGYPSANYIFRQYTALGKLIKPEDQGKGDFRLRFNRHYYINQVDNPVQKSKTIAALAALQEHGLTRESGQTVTMCHDPQSITEENFPITEEFVQQQKQRAMQRLLILLQYANTPNKNLRAAILRHFRDDSLKDTVKDLSLSNCLRISPRVTRCILTLLLNCDLPKNKLVSTLADPKTQPDEDEAIEFNSHEARFYVEHLCNLGLISEFAPNGKGIISITEKGLLWLKEQSVEPEIGTTYKELKQALLHPLAKGIIVDALEGWLKNALLQASDNLDAVAGRFLVCGFKVVDATVTGQVLVKDILHIQTKFADSRPLAIAVLMHYFGDRLKPQ